MTGSAAGADREPGGGRLHRADRRPRGRRHPDLGLHHDGAGHGARRRRTADSGWTYGPPACADVVRDQLADVVLGRAALDVAAAFDAMVRAVRNAGPPRHGRLRDLRGGRRPVGSQGPPARPAAAPAARRRPRRGPGLRQRRVHHLRRGPAARAAQWLDDCSRSRASRSKLASRGAPRPGRDLARIRQAREVIGPDAELYVDANGGYRRKQAVRVIAAAADCDVRWFEEPVSSDDLDGLRAVRVRSTPMSPPGSTAAT